MFYALLLLAIASRLLPHPPNMVCVGAIGLFAGCYLRGRIAWFVPIFAMFASDVIGHFLRLPSMGFYNPISMATVYAGFAMTTFIGRQLSTRRTGLRIVGGAIAASCLFFVLSNLGVWFSGNYEHTLSGLLRCYSMAIPFFGNTLAGDLLYSGLMFGIYEWSMQRSVVGKATTLEKPAF
ncbi:MAG: DUF6580 family putative transport protein [Pirellulaceae bacterium]